MYLTLDIEKQARPIVRNGESVSLIPSFLRSITSWVKTSLISNLDTFILSVEGFHRHVNELNAQDARELLGKVKAVITWFEKLQRQLEGIDFMNDPQLKEKFTYAQKNLFKLEALLHVRATSNVPVEKSESLIRTGLAKYSNEAIGSSLSGL